MPAVDARQHERTRARALVVFEDSFRRLFHKDPRHASVLPTPPVIPRQPLLSSKILSRCQTSSLLTHTLYTDRRTRGKATSWCCTSCVVSGVMGHHRSSFDPLSLPSWMPPLGCPQAICHQTILNRSPRGMSGLGIRNPAFFTTERFGLEENHRLDQAVLCPSPD